MNTIHFVASLLACVSLSSVAQSAEIPKLKSIDSLATLQGHTGGVNRLEFSADGRFLACGTGAYMSPGHVVTWKTNTWKRQYEKKDFRNAVVWLRFSPNGHTLAATSISDPLIVYDTTSGREILRADHIGTHSKPSLAAFAGDSNLLFIPRERERRSTFRITAWSLLQDAPNSGTAVSPDSPPDSPFPTIWYSVACSPNGKLLFAGGNDQATLWEFVTPARNLRAIRKVTTLPCRGAVKHVDFSPDGKWLAAVGSWMAKGGKGGRITTKVWDVATKQEVHSIETISIAFTPDSKRLAGLTLGDQCVRLWEVNGPSEPISLVPQPHVTSEHVWDFAISPANDLLATISVPKESSSATQEERENQARVRNVVLWDLETQQQLGAIVGHKVIYIGFGYPASAVAFDKQGKRLAIAAGEQVTIWDVQATLSKLKTARRPREM